MTISVAYLADAPLPSQAANAVQVLKMSAALASVGCDVTVYSPWHKARVREAAGLARLRDDFALDGKFRLRYLPFLAVGRRLAGSYFAVGALAAALTRADLVYTRNVRMAALCTQLGRSVILESHMPIGASSRGLAALHRVARSPLLRRWVFISARLLAIFRGLATLPDDRCVVEHDAVDLVRFTPAIGAAEARRQLGLSLERPLVVYCGHLYPGRGGDLLLEVAAALPHADMLLVGGQAFDVERLREAASARRLANVRLTGHRRIGELAPYLFAADVLVMPHTTRSLASDRSTAISDYASPMKLFEYMAAARAIVATRFPSVVEVLRDGENAVIVEPDSSAALTRAIDALLADPGRAARLGVRARADVETRTWTRRAERILDGIRAPALDNRLRRHERA